MTEKETGNAQSGACVDVLPRCRPGHLFKTTSADGFTLVIIIIIIIIIIILIIIIIIIITIIICSLKRGT